jgi:hypothetical protein
MNRGALFVIDTDPRTGGRAAEAVRIAAGVAVWKRIDVAVYLRGAAVLVLGENTDDLADAENYARYLPLLGESGRPICVQEGSPFLAHLGQSALPYLEISDAALAQLAVIRF